MAGFCELKSRSDFNYIDFDAKVMVSDYEESVDALDGENVGRGKVRGRMIRDVLGAFIGHKVTFQRDGSVEEFDRLWDWLKVHIVDDSIWIRAADNQTSIEYEAYYTKITRKLEKVENGVRYWGEITVNFIPIDPQLVPGMEMSEEAALIYDLMKAIEALNETDVKALLATAQQLNLARTLKESET